MIRKNKVVKEEEVVRNKVILPEEVVDKLMEIRTEEVEDVELNERRFLPIKGQRGRFQEFMVDEVFKLARFGHTNVEICQFFGVSQSTWVKWMRLYPELQSALYKGREEDGQKIVDSLHKQALGYEVEEIQKEYFFNKDGVKTLKCERKVIKNVLPSAKAGMYLLKVRFPNKWSETIKTENKSTIDINVNKKIDFSELSTEELMIMKKLGMQSLPEMFHNPGLKTIHIKEDVA